MTTQAYFQNIRKLIKEELCLATKSIYVAVAWFTDKQLFKMLCDKAQAGIEVQLLVMDDNITRNCSINYQDLVTAGGKLYEINESFGTLMHNKFCVIDEFTIITGSYNWSMKAASNHENITITKDAEALAITFVSEFKRIKEIYHGKEVLKTLDLSIVNRRLHIIENLISLEDYSEILGHINKLNEYEIPQEVIAIIFELEKAKWFTASNLIKDYLKKYQAVTIFIDLKLDELKWQIKYFELEIVSLENEKTTINKIISDFVHTYTLKFGDLLAKILNIKKEILKARGSHKYEAYKKAENDYNDFKQQFYQEKEKEKDYTHLSDDEEKELKKKYRKAATMCHPDAVANKFPDDLDKQKKAEELFKILKDAYDKNDLKKVSEILTNLENGIYDFEGDTYANTKREVLEARVAYLRKKLEALMADLIELRNNNTYTQILNINNFNVFYTEEELRLKNELKDIENEQFTTNESK